MCSIYIDDSSEKIIIRKQFLEFVHIKVVTASTLMSTIMQCLMAHGLDLEMLVSQSYNNASVTSGWLKGVPTIISKKYPLDIVCSMCNSYTKLGIGTYMRSNHDPKLYWYS